LHALRLDTRPEGFFFRGSPPHDKSCGAVPAMPEGNPAIRQDCSGHAPPRVSHDTPATTVNGPAGRHGAKRDILLCECRPAWYFGRVKCAGMRLCDQFYSSGHLGALTLNRRLFGSGRKSERLEPSDAVDTQVTEPKQGSIARRTLRDDVPSGATATAHTKGPGGTQSVVVQEDHRHIGPRPSVSSPALGVPTHAGQDQGAIPGVETHANRHRPHFRHAALVSRRMTGHA